MFEFFKFYAYCEFQDVSISATVKAGAVNVLITLNHPADVLFL